MNHNQKLHHPSLLAVWPGMGAVATSAGYYLISKLGMHLHTEYPPQKFFELSHVDVKSGLIQSARLPRSRLFVWHDPHAQHDLLVFIGEAQPAAMSNDFCNNLISHAKRLGVKDVFTFAAIATRMRPENTSRVFGAAIDRRHLSTFRSAQVELLDEGRISGLNGVLLEIAAESGMLGGCLLGEMPFAFPQLPFPKASLAVLTTFTQILGIELDFGELRHQAERMENELGKLLHDLEDAIEQHGEVLPSEGSTEADAETEPDEPMLSTDDQVKIEDLFASARQDRARAYELKQELDRLKVFHAYEDRFLDLFKKPNSDHD
ncbi:MAG: PAC2 family protein [Opitutales bacterium]|jgi:proteasome assembly chaperone (PAC2) family protein